MSGTQSPESPTLARKAVLQRSAAVKEREESGLNVVMSQESLKELLNLFRNHLEVDGRNR